MVSEPGIESISVPSDFSPPAAGTSTGTGSLLAPEKVVPILAAQRADAASRMAPGQGGGGGDRAG